MNILGVSVPAFMTPLPRDQFTGDIVFAGHAERYSKKKNDANINLGLILDACDEMLPGDHVAYYETPWKKQLRQWYAGTRH
jgi:hypothetical protein